MEPWPFSEAEWAAVSEAARPVVDAGLAEDALLRASHLINLLDVLASLRVCRRHSQSAFGSCARASHYKGIKTYVAEGLNALLADSNSPN
jgi:hypothetical protein